MSTPTKSIFFDLEIPVDDMMTDPKKFAEEVFAAAGRLTDILDHNSSQGGARSLARDSAKKNKLARPSVVLRFEEMFSSILSQSEDMDMDELFYLVDELKELSRQVELTFESRAAGNMIMNSPSATDKRLAMEQYKKLRESYDSYRKFTGLMHDIQLAPLKARSGNYGNAGRTTYPAYIYEGNTYHNYRTIARFIECPVEVKSHMDLQEYLAANNIDTVEIVEVTL